MIRVLGSGGEATPIDDSEIASIKLAINARTPVEPWPFLQAGEKVRITEGALAGVEGTLIQVKQEPRIVLSVTLLQRSVLLEIDRQLITRSVPKARNDKVARMTGAPPLAAQAVSASPSGG